MTDVRIAQTLPNTWNIYVDDLMLDTIRGNAEYVAQYVKSLEKVVNFVEDVQEVIYNMIGEFTDAEKIMLYRYHGYTVSFTFYPGGAER